MDILLQIITLVLAIVGVTKENFIKNEKLSIWTTWIILFLLFAVFIVQLILTINEKKEKKYSSSTGVLKCLNRSEEKTPIIVLGATRLNLVDGMSDLPFGDMTIKMIDNQVKITVNIRDSKGNLIGQIIENEWWIPTNYAVILDKNFNKNTLEIIDTKGNPLFQIQINGNEVCMAGYFRRKEGGITLGFLPWLHEIQNRKVTLFKYPSSKYPGKLQE